MASWMLRFLWHRCHRNPFSVYTRDISHAPVHTRNMLSKYRSAPGQGDCHSTWPWVHLTVRMLHDIYDMDVIISHPCHRYFFNKYGKLREKAGSTCNTVAVLPVAWMSWLWRPRQCHSRILLSKFFKQFLHYFKVAISTPVCPKSKNFLLPSCQAIMKAEMFVFKPFIDLVTTSIGLY